MRRIALLAIAAGFVVPLMASAPAHAQATRTWVSGVGDDANPCSRTAPCKTFPGAISKTAAGFSAVGALTLHGVTKDVPIDFQFTNAAGGAKLAGTAKLNRLDFGVGQGDWKSTEWVADAVKVSFSLVLKPKS